MSNAEQDIRTPAIQDSRCGNEIEVLQNTPTPPLLLPAQQSTR